jgi:hypothetical protein
MSLILILLPLLGGALAGLWVLSRALELGSPAWFKSWLRVWFGAGLAWACVMSALGAMASARALGWVEGPLGRLLFAAIILLWNPAVTGAVIGALAWWRWGLIDRLLEQQGARRSHGAGRAAPRLPQRRRLRPQPRGAHRVHLGLARVARRREAQRGARGERGGRGGVR